MYQINSKQDLEHLVCTQWDTLNSFIDEWQKTLPIPLTSSVDVRESMLKYAPVDHNMYPAGFNNICKIDLARCSQLFKEAFAKLNIDLKKIGLIPESHTKNKYYLESLFHLKNTIEASGAKVFVISPDPALFSDGASKIILESHSNQQIEIFKADLKNGTLIVPELPNISFDLFVLNHDQSSPLPIPWSEFKTPILPSPHMGWFKRQKINHFKHYQKTAQKFCEHFSINPDLIQAKFRFVENVDFETKEGLDLLGNEVELLLKDLPPASSVFVKASQGTYGMGISVVTSREEILSMNRKVRNKMDVGKNNLKFTSVLIQEGVETIVKFDNAPAEVTIYLIDGKAAGGFMRFNPLKGTQSNLNSQGMLYQKFCLSEIKQNHDHKNKEAVYSIIARLSVIAAAYEEIENK